MIDTPSELSRFTRSSRRVRVDAIERGGRFVHHENARVDREGLGDLDDLLLGD